MNQVIMFQNPDTAGICVLHPVLESGLTVEQIAAKDVPFGVPFKIFDASALPSDKYFRNAWRLVDGAVAIDIESAKEIQRNHWRAARAPKLAALDVDYMRALEAGNTELQVSISAAKQALRDVTLTPLPDDPNEIKAAWPAILS